MKCLKCGRETDQTFCPICREEMEKYPVKPGTIVLLPKERPSVKKPPSRHPAVPPEIILQNQRRTIRRLGHAFAALLVLTVLMGAAIVRLVQESGQRPVGQNYNTVTKPTGETTAPQASQEAGRNAAAPQSLDDMEDAVAPAELEDYIFYLEESQEVSELQAEQRTEEEPIGAPPENENVPRET